MSAFLLICALGFAESKALAVQICLDQRNFSCNTIDGSWGRKSDSALAGYASVRGRNAEADPPAGPEAAFDRWFAAAEGKLFRLVEVTQADLDAIVRIPATPAERARLDRLGYESIPEMFAERGHLSRTAFERINPGIDWSRVKPGTKVVLPSFPSIESLLERGFKARTPKPLDSEATLVKISLSRFELEAFNARGRLLAHFPCSIARDKAKIPQGELTISTLIPNPNYTYAEEPAANGKTTRHILPPGPNNPVGVAWMGLSRPGYGIHGTPRPESVGCAESHGCFRLSNWNAARLFAMARIGTRVVIED